MTNFKLDNGLFFMENGDAYGIPGMNENTNGVINFEEILSPYLGKRMLGDYEVAAKFTPVNMSLEDSYGIYIYSNDDYVYVSLQETPDGCVIKSGAVDFMETENPTVNVSGESVYLKIKKDGDKYEEFYSMDGIEYISCGKNILESDLETTAGYQVRTFQGSELYVKVTNTTIE